MTLLDKAYAVILAGGSGTRFWPKSRHLSPKQLCKIGDPDLTMIELTCKRLDDFIPPERRIIVTHKDQLEATKALCKDRVGLYLAEPDAKNTANALGYAALEIQKRSKDAFMISLHADHVIRKEDVFRNCLIKALEVANENFLTLLGIVPTYPETGYGYIERDNALPTDDAFRVKQFREKPNLETAKEFISTGNFYWNAGLFVWKVKTILDELYKRLPPSMELLESAVEGKIDIESAYKELPKISIDNAVLEVSTNTAVIASDIAWQDVGSWASLASTFGTDDNNNYISGDIISIDSSNCTLDTDGPLIATVGLKDHIVVHAKGSIMVCPTDRAQDVKLIVEHLKNAKRSDCL